MRTRKDDRGFITVQWALAMLMTMLLFVLIVNIGVIFFTYGATRGVLSEGVRAGSRAVATPADAEASCNAAINTALQPINGSGTQVQLQDTNGKLGCSLDTVTRRISVFAKYSPPTWLPSLVSFPDISIKTSARVEYIRCLDETGYAC